jgi:hypothetical protein
MSKEHKITKDGKKYITKISAYGCEGCSFHKKPACLIDDEHYHMCIGGENKDGMPRIWVEDTSKPNKSKPNKEKHYWIVEEYSKILGWSFLR